MQNAQPRSARQNESLITRQQPDGRPFAAGVFADVPASAIPAGGLAYAHGYIPFEDHAEPTGGCKLWSNVALPGLPGRTGYSLTKSGTTVTKTVGTDFTEVDIGNYVVFDDG